MLWALAHLFQMKYHWKMFKMNKKDWKRPKRCSDQLLGAGSTQKLSNKKCEGLDQIPVCFLSDCKDVILDPMASLFSTIYATGQIPEQWKVSKIIPIFKKGNKNEIENYRPIANLCSTSKIFENNPSKGMSHSWMKHL